MPYAITRQDNKYLVINRNTGMPMGKHDSRRKAIQQQRALYANEPYAKAWAQATAKDSFPILSVKEANHSGIMVALFLPTDVATTLRELAGREVDETEPAEDLHITIFYAGDIADITDPESFKAALADELRTTASGMAPITGVISGIGRFNTAEGDQPTPFYASYDSPALESARVQIKSLFSRLGIDQASEHGYTPHITLAYIPPDDDMPNLLPDPIPVQFDEIILAWGDERIAYPLTGDPELATKGYNAKAGEVIAGNLARGGDGKFTSAGNASAKKPKAPAVSIGARRAQRAIPKATKPGKGKKPKAPAKVKKPAAKPKSNAAAIRRAEAVKKAQARLAEQAKKKAEREAEQNKKKEIRAQETAKRLIKRKTEEAKRESAKKDREKKAAERKAEADRRRADKAKSGGSGKGGKAVKPADKPVKPVAPDKKLAKVENRKAVGVALGIDTDSLSAMADGATLSDATLTDFVKRGLVSHDAATGIATTTPTGRAFLRAAERGDERQARAFLQRAQIQQAKQESDRAAQDAAKRKGMRDPSGITIKSAPQPLIILKSAAGRYRWVIRASSGYQDRDGQWVTVKALAADCARADATGNYGTLRWWHMGTKNAQLMAEGKTPQPVIDIGHADWNAMIGPFQYISGTFIDDRWGSIVEKHADQLGASSGFYHLDGPTGRGHAFESIARREISILPSEYASNYFTGVLTHKESPMPQPTTKEQLERLAALVPAEDRDLIESLIMGDATAATKTATAQAAASGLTIKQKFEQSGATIDDLQVAIKALSGKPELASVTALLASLTTKEDGDGGGAADPDEAPEPEPDDGGESDSILEAADLAIIDTRIDERLAALGLVETKSTVSDLAGKVDIAVKALKAIASNLQTKGANAEINTEVAELSTTIKTLKSQIDNLISEQPLSYSYRASQGNNQTQKPAHIDTKGRDKPARDPLDNFTDRILGTATPGAK